jgi:sugar phosphate permease
MTPSSDKGDSVTPRRSTWRYFWVLFVGYLSYTLLRKAPGVATIKMIEALHFSKNDFGIVATNFQIAYGASKFVSSIISDHISGISMFLFGLFLCSVSNICLGLSSNVWTFCFFSAISGLSQGLGWCVRVSLMQKDTKTYRHMLLK